MNANDTIEKGDIMTENKASIIYQQIGGSRFRAMVGATHFLDCGNALKFEFKGSRKVNRCKIELNALDLYDVTFYQMRPTSMTCPEIKSVPGVYADQLTDIFEDVTGLATSL